MMTIKQIPVGILSVLHTVPCLTLINNFSSVELSHASNVFLRGVGTEVCLCVCVCISSTDTLDLLFFISSVSRAVVPKRFQTPLQRKVFVMTLIGAAYEF